MLAAPPHFFLFNCPAGATRYSSDQRSRIVRSNRIYISRLAEDCLGGLPGLLFCIQDTRGGESGVTLIGPVGLVLWFASAKAAFMRWLALNVDIIEVQADTVWDQQDVPITVHAFVQTGAELSGPTLKRRCTEDKRCSGSIADASCLAFFVRMSDHPGKFDVEAAKAFALVPRLHYAALKRGESVIATDGVEVHACQVVAAPIPGKSFAVVDHNGPVCPIFSESACARALKLRPDTVLHYAAAMTSQIELAIAQCGSAVHVGVWGAAVEMSTMCAGHAVRRMLCPHMFPCLVNLSALNTEPPPAPLLAALPGSMCDIAPPFKFGWQQSSAIPKQEELMQQWHAQIEQHRLSTPSNDVCSVIDATAALSCPPSTAWRVTFLGTGGALPSKHRNVSGILLSYKTCSGDGSLVCMRHILLDCGEGTTFQLVRLVGPAQASTIIAALDFVWLSHAHADHHLGLLDVAREFFRMTSTPLKVFAPTKLHVLHRRASDPVFEEGDAGPAPWLPLVSMWEGVPMQISLCSDLASGSIEAAAVASDAASAIRKHVPSCELLGVTAARVDHSCYDAWAIKCTMPDRTDVVYSGDTRPCEALEILGRSAELVIHEANFEDSMIELAELKKHSTTSGAIESCLRMNARITALTHFSARYPKVPKFAEHRNVFFAFDFSVLYPGLQVHPQLHGALALLFASEDGHDDPAQC